MNINNVSTEDILESINKGFMIQKPKKGETEILKVTKEHFFYRIGSENSKKVSLEEISWALEKLKSDGYFKRGEYEKAFPKISKSNPCNFTSIGGVLVTLGYAAYEDKGKYIVLSE